MTVVLMEALRGAGRDPRFHGNGFVQLYITENTRLHVWHPHVPQRPGHNAPVHSHTYDMVSVVLAGRLQQVCYGEPMRDPLRPAGRIGDQSRTHDLWELVGDKPAPGEFSQREMFTYIRTLALVETGRYTIAVGSSYTFARDQLHDSVPLGITATMFDRHPQPDDRRAPWVVCPLGKEPTNAFDPAHQPPLSVMWSVLEDAVAVMPRMSAEVLLGRLGRQ